MGSTRLALSGSATQSAMNAARSASLMGLHDASVPSPNITYGLPSFTSFTCVATAALAGTFPGLGEQPARALARGARRGRLACPQSHGILRHVPWPAHESGKRHFPAFTCPGSYPDILHHT